VESGERRVIDGEKYSSAGGLGVVRDDNGITLEYRKHYIIYLVDIHNMRSINKYRVIYIITILLLAFCNSLLYLLDLHTNQEQK